MEPLDVSDRFAISQAVQRYGRAIDEKRYEALGNVFSQGAHLAYSLGDMSFENPFPEIVETAFRPALELCRWTGHLISEPLIELKGTTVFATTRVIATHLQTRKDGSENLWVVTGEYSDEFKQTPDGWRIYRRSASFPCQQGTLLTDGVRRYASAGGTSS